MSTVDGFRGREKGRSSSQRLGVTRRATSVFGRREADERGGDSARRHCCLVCDTETIGRKDAFLARLVAHFEANGEYISAAELEDEMDL